MTEQQQLFADEYIKRRCKHGAQKAAAIAAGYSEKTAKAIAHNLMQREDVQRYIKERKSKLADELREEFLFDAIEAREVMNQIMNSGYSEAKDRINCAKDFLDRAGFKPSGKAEKDDDDEGSGVIILAEVNDYE